MMAKFKNCEIGTVYALSVLMCISGNETFHFRRLASQECLEAGITRT